MCGHGQEYAHLIGVGGPSHDFVAPSRSTYKHPTPPPYKPLPSHTHTRTHPAWCKFASKRAWQLHEEALPVRAERRVDEEVED